MMAVKEPEGLETRNAIITGAEISNDDHGVLTAWIRLDYGGECQGFGGYRLYFPKSFTNPTLESLAGHFIWRIMEIAGVSEWAELKGKTIRVRQNMNRVWEIGHIVKDIWFCPAKDYGPATERNNGDDGMLDTHIGNWNDAIRLLTELLKIADLKKRKIKWVSGGPGILLDMDDLMAGLESIKDAIQREVI